jgi:FkbM family methyltransferase
VIRIPIVAGPLRGTWWLPQSGGKVLRFLNGTYEPQQTKIFTEQLRRGHTLIDVGAHVGYYALLAAKLVGEQGRVYAFEPNPRNCAFLKQHVAVNALENVRVEQTAVSDRNGTARFHPGKGSGTGRLATSGPVEVATIRLDDFCAANHIAPNAIKCDVEGAELDVLRGGERTILTHKPVLFLSTHGTSIHNACMSWLRERGYELSPINGDDVNTAAELLCTPLA